MVSSLEFQPIATKQSVFSYKNYEAMPQKHIHMDTTPEELAAEQAAAQAPKEEEIRSSVIAEFGFDEVADAERIDKLVTKEMDNRKALSSAIGQKIKWRDEAKKPKEPAAPPVKVDDNDLDKKLDEKLTARLEKQALDELEYPAELKAEIQKVAQAQNIGVKQAARDPYIVFKVSEYEKEQKTNEAAISRTNRSSGKQTFSLDNPPEVDMTTEAGRKTWDEYLKAMKAQGN